MLPSEVVVVSPLSGSSPIVLALPLLQHFLVSGWMIEPPPQERPSLLVLVSDLEGVVDLVTGLLSSFTGELAKAAFLLAFDNGGLFSDVTASGEKAMAWANAISKARKGCHEFRLSDAAALKRRIYSTRLRASLRLEWACITCF